MQVKDVALRALEQVPFDDAVRLVVRHLDVAALVLGRGGLAVGVVAVGRDGREEVAEPRLEVVFMGGRGMGEGIELLHEAVVGAARKAGDVGQAARVRDKQDELQGDEEQQPRRYGEDDRPAAHGGARGAPRVGAPKDVLRALIRGLHNCDPPALRWI